MYAQVLFEQCDQQSIVGGAVRYKIPLAKGLLLTENLALRNHNKTELIHIQLATFKNCEHGEFLLDQLSCCRNPT